jgi:hypothetical protein
MFTLSIIVIAICTMFLLYDLFVYVKTSKQINKTLEKCFASLKEREENAGKTKDNC